MTLTQEELNRKFPLELTEKQFALGWYELKTPTCIHQVVIVYDKASRRVVYKGESKHRKDHRKHIEKFYGESNCDPLKAINPRFYEGL